MRDLVVVVPAWPAIDWPISAAMKIVRKNSDRLWFRTVFTSVVGQSDERVDRDTGHDDRQVDHEHGAHFADRTARSGRRGHHERRGHRLAVRSLIDVGDRAVERHEIAHAALDITAGWTASRTKERE